MNSLYHFHIPKTGGSYISYNLIKSGLEDITINNNKIKIYTGTEKANFDYLDFDVLRSSNYVHGHFGVEPLSINPEIRPFTTIRNPITRVISHFAMIYFPLKNSQIMNTFNSWLFDDSIDMIVKNNFQSIFLTNEVSKDYINKNKELKMSFEKHDNVNFWKDGFGIDNKYPSISQVRDSIEKMVVVDKTENMDIFMNKLYAYINNEYKCSLEYLKIPAPRIERYSTQLSSTIKKNLTKEQKDKIESMNYLDLEIWNSLG